MSMAICTHQQLVLSERLDKGYAQGQKAAILLVHTMRLAAHRLKYGEHMLYIPHHEKYGRAVTLARNMSPALRRRPPGPPQQYGRSGFEQLPGMKPCPVLEISGWKI